VADCVVSRLADANPVRIVTGEAVAGPEKLIYGAGQGSPRQELARG
jgi:hypothetical protein